MEKYYICKEKNNGNYNTYLLAVNKIGGCVTIDDINYAKKYETKTQAQFDIDKIANHIYPYQILEFINNKEGF